MVNPPLIVVSALFFLALVCLFYACSWAAASLILFLLRPRFSHTASRQLLFAGMLLPPLLAAVPTLGGVTLRHGHATMFAAHHSAICLRIFGSIFSLESLRGSPAFDTIAGAAANGLAWFLLLSGLYLVFRLVAATIRLERGISPYLLPPSPPLDHALARVKAIARWKSRVYECPIPPSCSSVLGAMGVRCVLSQELVAAAGEEELDAVLAHEAEHLRMGDVRAAFIIRGLSSLFFFLWPARMIARRWHEEVELACDAAATRATGKPLAMAAAILRAGGVPLLPRDGDRLPAGALGFADDDACSPEKRVERLIWQAAQSEMPPGAPAPAFHVAGWIATIGLAAIGVFVLMSSQTACFAHCSLEAVARLLP